DYYCQVYDSVAVLF
nr:immunoglobulin light chain junction region [Macaca mulatta]